MALALKIPLRNPKEMTLRGINTACSQYVHEADLEIADSSSSVKYPWKKVLVMENPQIPQLIINRSHVFASHKHLKGINFPNLKTCDVTALLGLDVFDLIVGRNILSGPANTPTAFQCLLGWFRTGPCMSTSEKKSNQNKIVDTYFCDDCFSRESALLDKVSDWWQVESQGTLREKDIDTIGNQKALKILESTCNKTPSGHNETG